MSRPRVIIHQDGSIEPQKKSWLDKFFPYRQKKNGKIRRTIKFK